MRLFELLNVLNRDEIVTVYGKKVYRDTVDSLNKNSCEYLGSTIKHVGIRWFSVDSVDDPNATEAELSIGVEE